MTAKKAATPAQKAAATRARTKVRKEAEAAAETATNAAVTPQTITEGVQMTLFTVTMRKGVNGVMIMSVAGEQHMPDGEYIVSGEDGAAMKSIAISAPTGVAAASIPVPQNAQTA